MDNTWLLRTNKERMSIAEARQVLEQSGTKYTDEEIQQILGYLYALIEIQHEDLLKKAGLWVEDRPAKKGKRSKKSNR